MDRILHFWSSVNGGDGTEERIWAVIPQLRGFENTFWGHCPRLFLLAFVVESVALWDDNRRVDGPGGTIRATTAAIAPKAKTRNPGTIIIFLLLPDIFETKNVSVGGHSRLMRK